MPGVVATLRRFNSGGQSCCSYGPKNCDDQKVIIRTCEDIKSSENGVASQYRFKKIKKRYDKARAGNWTSRKVFKTRNQNMSDPWDIHLSGTVKLSIKKSCDRGCTTSNRFWWSDVELVRCHKAVYMALRYWGLSPISITRHSLASLFQYFNDISCFFPNSFVVDLVSSRHNISFRWASLSALPQRPSRQKCLYITKILTTGWRCPQSTTSAWPPLWVRLRIIALA